LQLERARRIAREAELAAAEQRLEEARWAVEMQRLNHYAKPITLKAAQQLLQPQEALIQFHLGEQRSYVWLITAEDVRWAALPGRQAIEEQVRPYLKMLAGKPLAPSLERELALQQSSGKQLFDLLLGPFAGQLTASQRLTLAPDGLLHYLPFETLIRDGRYLIEQHELRYIPSASVLALLSPPRANAAAQTQMELLAFGNPIFGPTRQTAGKPGSEFWSSSSLRLHQLPQTRAEVLFISELFPPATTKIYLGRAATEEALKRERLDRYRRLHFATHGLVDDQFPARSGVALTLADKPREDGLLELAEIAELKLDCELVVLSACGTGHGQLVRGEGIVGLTRAFLYAGARSVAVSLWDVSDISTPHFMRGFYRHLAAGSNAAVALRQAKLAQLNSGEITRHPSFWAPFVLVGNTQ
jgi:CHAT domain-containing protein